MESALKLLEDALREAPDAIVVCDAEARITFVNRAARRLAGRDPDASDLEFTPETWGVAHDARGRAVPLEEWSHSLALRGAPTPVLEARMSPPEGDPYEIRISSAPLRDARGTIVGAVTLFTDVTPRKRAEERLRQIHQELESRIAARTDELARTNQALQAEIDHAHGAEAALIESQRELEVQRRFLRQIIDLDPNFVFAKDRAGRFTLVNQAVAEAYGTTVGGLIGKTDADFNPNAEEVEFFRRMDLEVMDTLQVRDIPEERITDAKGEVRWLQTVKIPVIDESGHAGQILGVAADITARKLAEEGLVESQRFIRQVADSMPSALYVFDLTESRMVYANPQAEALFTGSGDSSGSALEHLVHPDDLAAVRARREAFADLGEGEYVESEFRVRSGKGAPRWLSDRETVIRRSPGGAPERILGIAQDITERRALQEQLLQARKLESIGRLAGGVAHDFNNLLTVIIGLSDLALAELAPPSPEAERMASLRHAAEQAAQLTRQLLAFARRQMVEPRVIDLNDLVRDAERILRRLIGEEIALDARLGAGPWPIRVDPGQMMQVIVNLALNARDAMPRGGTITLATDRIVIEPEPAGEPEAPPGEYVGLTVSDTGLGMSEDVKARIFDPFFTTKELGRGTGLGLASVYGTVRQSGGYIEVTSVPGSGTTFRVLLPRSEDPCVSLRTPEPASPVPAGTETILVVEDNAMVRRAVVQMLRARGYSVLEAGDGPEGERIAASTPTPIHLLLTDIVMPGMSGTELARRLVHLNPALKVLFMSGYAETAVEPPSGPSAIPILTKPFTAEALARKVRAALEGSRPRASTGDA